MGEGEHLLYLSYSQADHAERVLKDFLVQVTPWRRESRVVKIIAQSELGEGRRERGDGLVVFDVKAQMKKAMREVVDGLIEMVAKD